MSKPILKIEKLGRTACVHCDEVLEVSDFHVFEEKSALRRLSRSVASGPSGGSGFIPIFEEIRNRGLKAGPRCGLGFPVGFRLSGFPDVQ